MGWAHDHGRGDTTLFFGCSSISKAASPHALGKLARTRDGMVEKLNALHVV